MFEIEEQKVYLSDCRDLSELEKSIDFIFTSPPYWNLKKYGGPDSTVGETDYEQYLADMNKVWDECFRISNDNAVLAVNINIRRHKKRLYPIPFDIVSRMKQWTLWDINIWHIPNALPQCKSYMERLLDNKFEYILIFVKNLDYHFSKPRVPQKYIEIDPRANKNEKGRCLGNIIRIPAYRPPNIKKMNYHVAAFPEELVAFYLQLYTSPKNMVLDPFLGSGTTLKVCRIMGRNGIGYEIIDKYEDLIKARIMENWTPPDWRDLDILSSK